VLTARLAATIPKHKRVVVAIYANDRSGASEQMVRLVEVANDPEPHQLAGPIHCQLERGSHRALTPPPGWVGMVMGHRPCVRIVSLTPEIRSRIPGRR
jgi:hypothetical protein